MTSKTQMTKAQLISALSEAEQTIEEMGKTIEQLEQEKVHIGAKLLDDKESNIVAVLKARIESLEKQLSQEVVTYPDTDNID